jgi:UDP-N-acetylmuramoylalanine-D-glutamate ligase
LAYRNGVVIHLPASDVLPGAKIAIVGTGVSGLVAAHLLHREHELFVHEAGGHALRPAPLAHGQRRPIRYAIPTFRERWTGDVQVLFAKPRYFGA